MMSISFVRSKYIYTEPTDNRFMAHASIVKFANMSMATIPKAAFENLIRCKTLVFTNTKTIQIDPEAWLGLSHLQHLLIEESSMITLDADMFRHLKSLTRLKVTSAPTEYFSFDSTPLKPAAFRSLDSLKYLWLSMPNLNEHTIRSMDHEIWKDIADTLTELRLSGNNFRKLYDDMFIQFSKLEKLSFHNNRITMISSKALNGLELLKEVDLSQNRINELTYNTFQSLTFLSEINLSENEIEHLADNLFKGLKHLIILKLNNNRLWTIECNVFDPMDFNNTGGHPGKIIFLH